MSSMALAVISFPVTITIAVAWWVLVRRRRSEHLRKRFVPEYDRMINKHYNQRCAEAVLDTREKRVQHLQIRLLTQEDHDHFAKDWQADQTRFVDDPEGAVTEADRLITELMKTRGYPVSDFKQRVADISVDHPHFVVNYRAAAEIAQRHRGGQATTEDLRQAMLYYRKLFDDLLETAQTTK